MKNTTTKSNACPETKTTSSNLASKYVLAALAALPLGISTAHAEEAAAPAPPPSKTHALINFEFSDKYLTPRGMIVQSSGLVFQPLVLGFFNVYGSDNFSATIVGGVWNCFGTGRIPSSDSDGHQGTSWYEIDPIAGVSFGICKDFTLDITYTAFDMQIFNIPFSQHLETKLSYNDSKLLKAFALHPYVSVWKELDGKAVANTDAKPVSSYYVDVGVAPSYTFEKIGLKIEAPCRVLLPDDKFYGTGEGTSNPRPSSTLGLYEVGLKGTIPLKFMPDGYGHWSFHLGGKYMGYEDANLKATQHENHVWQIYCGLTTFF